MRQQLHAGPREDAPLIVDRCDGQRLRVHHHVGRVVEPPFSERRVQRRRLDDLSGRHLLQTAVEPDHDRLAHVGDHAAAAVPLVS